MRKGAAKKSRSINFELIAPFYDLGIWFTTLFIGGEKRFRDDFLREAMPLENKKTLEIFAGTATLSLLAAKYGARVTATDISAPMLRVAREKSKKLAAGLNLVRADSASLPFGGATFERVLVCMGLHEVEPSQAKEAIQDAARILQRGGRIIIEDYNRALGLAGTIQRIFFLFTEGMEVRDWLNCDIQGILRDAGFKGFQRKFFHRGLVQIITAEKA